MLKFIIMANIVLISNNEEYEALIEGGEHNLRVFSSYDESIFEGEEDVILLDFSVENSKLILMNLIGKNSPKSFEIFCIIKEEEAPEFKNKGVKFIISPVKKEILLNEINLALNMKNQLQELHKENMELKKNLYQIDAFYNASSKFAGTLDKEKLYEVMFETFERVLSYDIACALFKDNFEEDKLKFYINSLKKTTPELNSALIRRLAITAKEDGINELKPNRCEVETIQNVKPSYKNDYYDTEVAAFDTLFAPIIVKDKFEGVIEIFRKTPFTKEDVTCFQSIVHQVLAPLRSAILYEDIKNTNVKLKKLEKMKSEFVSIVSHELRTPLTPINNALSIILSEQGGKIGDVNKNFANIAKRNVARLSGIIEDLLDLSRMQTGKFEFKFKKSEIYPSLELAFNTFKNQAAEKSINLKLNVCENLPSVYVDQHRIDQILSNLITNAIKFTKENGEIELSASVCSNVDKNLLISPSFRDYSGEFVKIDVKDTGVGIDEEDIPKIFDKFSQIENSLSRNTGGIGLGLTITKHFIDAHLGGIWVISKKNEGSTFSFVIPVYTDKKAFEVELNLKIKNESETGYFEIEEKNGNSFYTHLKEANIIKLTKHSIEFEYEDGEKHISKVLIPNLERSAYEFMVSKIQDEISSKDKTCDILLTEAYHRKDSV